MPYDKYVDVLFKNLNDVHLKEFLFLFFYFKKGDFVNILNRA
jgi:hypothetical protein